MAGENPRELAAEFGAIRELRPGLGKAVFHASLSAAPGEQLRRRAMAEIGQEYLAGMGFTDHQYVISRHTDTAHEHIHILANRIGSDGQVVSDGHDYQRQERLMREIEREYDLHEVAPSREAERRAPTKGEIEQSVRTGEPSTRQRLQGLCADAAQGCDSFTVYVERAGSRRRGRHPDRAAGRREAVRAPVLPGRRHDEGQRPGPRLCRRRHPATGDQL